MAVFWTVIFCIGFVAIEHVMSACPNIVSRAQWGANPPRQVENMTLPVPYVVVHHTHLPAACDDTDKCKEAMRTMQFMHQITRGWNDIGYNFCVGGDGKVYEGRGWERVGAHAPKYNFMSVGICFIGDYQVSLPSAAMFAAAKSLIECGIENGIIGADYKLIGHKQVRDTLCPGGLLFDEIKTWPHWSSLEDVQPRAVAPSTPDAVVTTEATTDDTTISATTEDNAITEVDVSTVSNSVE